MAFRTAEQETVARETDLLKSFDATTDTPHSRSQSYRCRRERDQAKLGKYDLTLRPEVTPFDQPPEAPPPQATTRSRLYEIIISASSIALGV